MKENIIYVIRYDSIGTAYIEIIKYKTYQERYELTKNDSLYGICESLEEAQEKQYQLNRL